MIFFNQGMLLLGSNHFLIKKSLACIACNDATTDEADEKQCDTITCPSCKIALLKDVMKVKLVCQIIVNNQGKIRSYTFFKDAIYRVLS